MELDSNGTVPLRSPSLDRIAANSGALSMELDNAEIGAKPKGSAATAIMTHCGIQSKAIQELPDRTNGTMTNTGNAGSGSSVLSHSVATTLPQFSRQEEGAQPMQVYMVKQKYPSVERTEAVGDPYTAAGSSDTAGNGKSISIPGLIERITVLTGRSYDPPSGDCGYGAFSPRISRVGSPSCLISNFPLHNASAAMNECIQDVNNVGLPIHLEGAETDPHGTDCLDPRRCTQSVCQNATMRAELNNGSQSFQAYSNRQEVFRTLNSHTQEAAAARLDIKDNHFGFHTRLVASRPVILRRCKRCLSKLIHISRIQLLCNTTRGNQAQLKPRKPVVIPLAKVNFEDISDRDGVAVILDASSMQENIQKLEVALAGKLLGKKLPYYFLNNDLK